MNNRFDLTDRVALVTGASSGLGFSISEALAAAGATVVVTSSNQERIQKAADELTSKYGKDAIDSRCMDVSQRNAIRKTVADVAADYGKIDILVANAGISAGPGFKTEAGCLSGVTDEKWDEVLAVNLTGVFTSISAVAPHMIERRSGRIVVISSIGGLRSEDMVGYAYVSTKAAVINLVRQTAMELAQHNVNVNAIAPGPFITNIADGRFRNEEFAANVAQRIPLGRLADPDEIKELALLLCSDASSFITGQTIAIDGGLTAH